MTQLAAVILTVRPVEPVSIPHWTGLGMRAWFLEQVQQCAPSIAAAIHDHDGPKPYTVSGLVGLGRLRRERPRLSPERQYFLRITTMQNDLTQIVTECLLPQWTGQEVEIAGARLRIEATTMTDDGWAGQTTDADLVQQWTLGTEHLPKHLELEFDSPTAFKQQGATVPFPLPDLVFGNLIDRWNEFNNVQLHPDTRQFAQECVVVSKYRLETKYVEFDGSKQAPMSGCIGVCRYVILKGDRYWRGLLHALAAYSFYAGIGRRSTIGLGRVRVRE